MTQKELITAPIEQELAQMRVLFDNSLVCENGMLRLVMDYVKQRTGKMMRPILVLLMARLFGQPKETAQHAALALELLHTASLIHDDVVDESEERRGQPAVHVRFNNKYAVLTGDFLLGLSLQHAAMTQDVEVVKIVAQLGKDLSEGEIIQLENTQNQDFLEEIYFEIIRKKTAALFVACALSGARSVGATPQELEKAALFGDLMGIAFQIRDDIFDYYDSEEIGKPTGNDMHEGKLTLPALYLINRSQDPTVKETAHRIRARQASAEEIAGFVARVKTEGGIAYAEAVMNDYRKRALDVLSDYAGSEVYTSLKAYMDYVIDRKK